MKAHRFGFNGMEMDDEMHNSTGTSYDFGARMYDPRVGRWSSLDPLAAKYPAYTPYSFVNNMPIWAIDPDGKDIIILSAPDNVGGYGHAAVLIGNDKDGYRLYSDNGTDSKPGSKGPSDDNPEIGVLFSSLEEFANSSSNRNEDGSIKYTAAFQIETDKETDEKMAKAAAVSVGQDYKVFTNNCIDACSDALSAGNLDPGYSPPVVQEASLYHEGEVQITMEVTSQKTLSPIPNTRFEMIKKNNTGTDVSNKIKPTVQLIEPVNMDELVKPNYTKVDNTHVDTETVTP